MEIKVRGSYCQVLKIPNLCSVLITGFIAFNNEGTDFNQNLQTCLPEGVYCDVITGQKEGNSCTGTTVYVGANQVANIVIAANAEDGVLAIHRGSLVSYPLQTKGSILH